MRDLFSVYLSPANLLKHGLTQGSPCQFETSQGVSCTAIVFDNPKIQDSVIQTSKTFQGLYNIKLGDKISLTSSDHPIANAKDVVIRESPHDDVQLPIAERYQIHWAWLAKDALKGAIYLCPGLPLDNIETTTQKKSFQVLEINGSSELTVYRFEHDMNVEIRLEPDELKDNATADTMSSIGRYFYVLELFVSVFPPCLPVTSYVHDSKGAISVFPSESGNADSTNGS